MVSKLLRRGAMTAVGVVGLQAAYAVLRPYPVMEQFDPSAEFGDPLDPELRVVVVGDSSVTAPGVSGPHEIWISLICNRLAETRHVVLKSYAVGGSMAHDVIDGQLDQAISFAPDLAFVSVGANDVIKGVSVQRFAENLDVIVARLTGSGAVVIQSGVGVMGTIPRLHPPLSAMVSRRAWRFDRAHRLVAERYGTSVVDHRSDDVRIWNTDMSLWAADLFHVSAAGHARWAETTWRTVEPVMNGTSGPS
jgi:lysophospholipase L1-like esterase